MPFIFLFLDQGVKAEVSIINAVSGSVDHLSLYIDYFSMLILISLDILDRVSDANTRFHLFIYTFHLMFCVT